MAGPFRFPAALVALLATQAALGARVATRVEKAGVSRVSSKETPVSKVVKLLRAMQVTVAKDMEEDDALHSKLMCWCSSGKWEKGNAAETSETRIAQLKSTVEGLVASEGELNNNIKDLEGEIAADKTALSEAEGMQERQQTQSTSDENQLIQAVSNLKAAIVVLSKHQGPADNPLSFLAVDSLTDSWTKKHEATHMDKPLEDFMETAGLEDGALASRDDAEQPSPAADSSAPGKGGFLQSSDSLEAEAADEPLPDIPSDLDPKPEPALSQLNEVAPVKLAPVAPPAAPAGMPNAAAAQLAALSTLALSPGDMTTVQNALKSAMSLLQARGGASYVPAYSSQSGQVVGVLKQMKEDMERQLKEVQGQFSSEFKSYQQLRSSKTDEIGNEQQQSEEKEDELATTEIKLAEAKDDLLKEERNLEATRQFLASMETTCATAKEDFEKRKQARMAEAKALAETLEVLMEDDARDAMGRTFSLLQQGRRSSQRGGHRQVAAAALRAAARRAGDPQLTLLASSVALDAFEDVKRAMEKMLVQLRAQQEDEVKKVDYCKSAIGENELQSEKKQAVVSDIQAKLAQIASDLETISIESEEAKKAMSQLQLELQEASKDRQADHLQFQKTVQDQELTMSALNKALDRLGAFYRGEERREEALIEKGLSKGQQPEAQMSYEPNGGAEGVMQLLETLIKDAEDLIRDSKLGEDRAQSSYQQTVHDTNDSVRALQRKIQAKIKETNRLKKEKLEAEAEVKDRSKELQSLADYGKSLHGECDYLIQNFEKRQEARNQEMDSLGQAKQILNGASYDA